MPAVGTGCAYSYEYRLLSTLEGSGSHRWGVYPEVNINGDRTQ
ncbi:hypothetical protein [Clostridium lacusfryxellense]|nr:hypothetical protein [Clostridium lacusfryxellense]